MQTAINVNADSEWDGVAQTIKKGLGKVQNEVEDVKKSLEKSEANQKELKKQIEASLDGVKNDVKQIEANLKSEIAYNLKEILSKITEKET